MDKRHDNPQVHAIVRVYIHHPKLGPSLICFIMAKQKRHRRRNGGGRRDHVSRRAHSSCRDGDRDSQRPPPKDFTYRAPQEFHHPILPPHFHPIRHRPMQYHLHQLRPGSIPEAPDEGINQVSTGEAAVAAEPGRQQGVGPNYHILFQGITKEERLYRLNHLSYVVVLLGVVLMWMLVRYFFPSVNGTDQY
ncbi:uncharacterized protein Z518_04859 [Rhinocladiella mackenziei CBS 650.93]|uniref:Uncharacterized protein n=1 Tax=Rhinocladiella mackenziei CBS 650.93 TaxID=1442369 RepID=A0A0D2H8T8_9EURO|nr:uncharacterized protein Z518_04859 [Rhinocladiella mackenziei CBS 650.93]KIX06883.1 hypothetical protein Z518_04859 [Rhinocladiella mackenziei CBS 650.93]